MRSDCGGEYLSNDFISYLSEQGITSQMSASRTPQQNGVAERRNRTLLEMVRSMMSYLIALLVLGICLRNCKLHSELTSF